MNKAAIKVLSINLLVFTAYTLVSMQYSTGWIFMIDCLFIHVIVCLLLAFSNEESLPKGAFIISLLLILLIGIGTCTHLFSESLKHLQ
jgi:hypothetical protein